MEFYGGYIPMMVSLFWWPMKGGLKFYVLVPNMGWANLDLQALGFLLLLKNIFNYYIKVQLRWTMRFIFLVCFFRR